LAVNQEWWVRLFAEQSREKEQVVFEVRACCCQEAENWMYQGSAGRQFP
jgi:hypothetical protein